VVLLITWPQKIIRGDPYGPEVDIWSIGVITYVMLSGFPPFDGENDIEVFASILSIRYDFPSPEWDKISTPASNFIQSLLVDNPKQRLTATQCLQHPWITENVPLELRTNNYYSKVPPLQSEEKLVRLKSEMDLSGLPLLDMKRPKQHLKELIEEILRSERCGASHVAEVKVIGNIVEATSGIVPLSDLEKVIYLNYYKRIQEMQYKKNNRKSKK